MKTLRGTRLGILKPRWRWSRLLALFLNFPKILPQITQDTPIPQLEQAMHFFRKAEEICQIKARNMKFKTSTYADCLSEWNMLHPDIIIRLSPSLSIFKTKLFKLIRPTPKLVCGIHDPKGLVTLIQLQVGLSKLNFIDLEIYRVSISFISFHSISFLFI